MTTRERRYVLTKVARGDYLLPSNDGQTIWRLATYEDGIAQGLDHDLGTVWGVWKWVGRGTVVNPSEWEMWEMWASTLSTRSEAIEAALGSTGVTDQTPEAERAFYEFVADGIGDKQAMRSALRAIGIEATDERVDRAYAALWDAKPGSTHDGMKRAMVVAIEAARDV